MSQSRQNLFDITPPVGGHSSGREELADDVPGGQRPLQDGQRGRLADAAEGGGDRGGVGVLIELFPESRKTGLDLGQRAHRRAHHGHASAHGLGEGQRKALVLRGLQEDIEGRQHVTHLADRREKIARLPRSFAARARSCCSSCPHPQ